MRDTKGMRALRCEECQGYKGRGMGSVRYNEYQV